MLEIVQPHAPCEATLTDPTLTFPSKCGKKLLTYCPRTNSGGQYSIDSKAWLIVTGVTPQLFIEFLRETGIVELPDSIDRCAWVMGVASESWH